LRESPRVGSVLTRRAVWLTPGEAQDELTIGWEQQHHAHAERGRPCIEPFARAPTRKAFHRGAGAVRPARASVHVNGLKLLGLPGLFQHLDHRPVGDDAGDHLTTLAADTALTRSTTAGRRSGDAEPFLSNSVALRRQATRGRKLTINLMPATAHDLARRPRAAEGRPGETSAGLHVALGRRKLHRPFCALVRRKYVFLRLERLPTPNRTDPGQSRPLLKGGADDVPCMVVGQNSICPAVVPLSRLHGKCLI